MNGFERANPQVYYNWRLDSKKTHAKAISVTDKYNRTTLNFCVAIDLKVKEGISRANPQYTFADPVSRRLTFMGIDWPEDNKSKPHDIIQSGLYISRRSPLTLECYRCYIRIKWRKEYTADLIHFEKRRSCPLMNHMDAINRIITPMISPRNNHIMESCTSTQELMDTMQKDGPVCVNQHKEETEISEIAEQDKKMIQLTLVKPKKPKTVIGINII